MFTYGRYRVFASYLTVAFLLSDVPQLFLIWLSWRLLTITLSDSIFQKGDDIIFSLFHRTIVFFAEHLTGAQVFLYGDGEQVLKKKERVLYLSNHQSDADWVLVHMLALRQGILNQVRYIVKNSIQMVPFFGHALYQHASIYVKAGQFNQEKMVKYLKYLKNPNIKTSMVLFPEGTRYNLVLEKRKTILEIETDYIKKLGLQPMKHLLLPRYRGMGLIVSELSDQFDAVYDITIIYEGTKDSKTGIRTSSPSMFELLRLSRPKLHMHVNRIEIKDIPKSGEKLKSWLYELYARKDRLLEEYYGSEKITNIIPGGFLSRPICSTLSKWETFPSFLFYLALWIPVFYYSHFWFLYWTTFVFGALGCYAWLGYRSIS